MEKIIKLLMRQIEEKHETAEKEFPLAITYYSDGSGVISHKGSKIIEFDDESEAVYQLSKYLHENN